MKHRLAALSVGVAMAMAACSGGDGDSTDADAGASAEGSSGGEAAVDEGGIARFSYDLVGSAKGGFSWNPADSTTNVADLGLYHMVYGGLMRPGPDGKLVADLAEEATLVDGTTIEITLREGVTFAGGEPLTAELVRLQLESNLSDPTVPAYQAAFHSLKTVEVTGPGSLRLGIPDGTAASWFDNFMGGVETVVIPPGTDFDKPSGAGPFTVTSFEPEQKIVMEKSPTYWDADSIRVAGLEAINISADTQAGISALNAGQVDFTRLDYAELDALGSDMETLVEPSPGQLVSFQMCKSTEPFDDPQVRLALSRAIDRDAINEALYGGTAIPAYSVWPEGHRFYLEGLEDDYGFDLEAAKELLADAGYEDGFSFDLMTLQVAGMPEVAQVVQQQWAELGVDMNIVPAPNYVQDFFIDKKGPMGIIPVLGLSPRLNQWVAVTTNNPCQYQDPELNQMAAEIATLSSESQEAVDLWKEIQAKMAEEALSLFVVYQSAVNAYDPARLGDVQVSPYVLVVPDVWSLFVKAG